jgi:4-diphosphocytidyl-2-C-methyl-D-erythritol kinase
MVCFPNAKINLGLNIINKRTDGFHNLETVFYPVGLADVLEFIPNTKSKETVFQSSGIIIDAEPEKNLVMKAYRILQQDFDLPALKIHLHKVIPSGAGLGGGSADAAFMITALNNHFNLQIDDNKLIEYASYIGSDCAFFIKNIPSFASGRGDILQSIVLDLKHYWFTIVKPSIHVSTAEAYGGVKPEMPVNSLSKLIALPVEKWRNIIKNDFEEHIFIKYPQIAKIKEQLYQIGAIYASMSGSGSSVFGMFKEEPDMKGLFEGCFIWKSMGI